MSNDSRVTRTAARAAAPHRREGGVTLSALRTFVAVAEVGSLSKAAQTLGVSQPSVSIQLAGLEEACGVMLLRRRPSVALTDAGRDLFVRARLIVSRLDEFDDSVRELRGLRRGRLCVGLSTPHWAMPLIASFLERHPAIEVTTALGNTATLLDDIGRCRVDVGVMTLLGPDPQFACSLIGSPRLAICVRRDDPIATRPSVRPGEVLHARFVMREQGSMTRRVLESAFDAEGVTPKIAMEVGSREALKEAIAAGIGIGGLFDEEFGHDDRLRLVPLVATVPASGVYAVALKESLEIPTVRAFIEHAAAPGRGRASPAGPVRPGRTRPTR